MRKIGVLVVIMVLALSAAVHAGEYYLSDDKAYWWYWDDNPKYEIMIPAKGLSYAPLTVFGERSIDITLTKNGPVMRVSSVAQINGGYAALKQGALQRWQHVLRNVKISSESDITTSVGVKAKFFTISGKTADGTAAMIRFVAYLKDNDAVYIELYCNEKDYAGDIKNYWIKAVNTFKWR